MVLSATKIVSSSSSITNESSNGGNKKAGLPYQVGRSSYSSISMNGSTQNYTFLKTTANPNVKVSRPIGSNPMVWR